MAEKIIDLKNIVKAYGDNVVVDHMDLYIRKGEFVTFLGPSGCGKTTTLRMIAGFEMPDEGEILFEGKNLLDIPPHLRPINTVFQRYALFPHLNVFDNIAFGLRLKRIETEYVDKKGNKRMKKTKLPKNVIEKKVYDALKMVGLTDYDFRDVNSLSGGQQQRVAIARAIVNEPKVLLLDEPLGALDLKMRKEMQLELKEMHKKLGITFIYVTHDQEEALTMSDTVVVMKNGLIQQIGTPTDIYNEPKNAFVADFIGESNIFDGIMKEDCKVVFDGAEYDCVDKGFNKNEPVDVVIRPEDVYLLEEDNKNAMAKGVIVSKTFKGMHYEMGVRVKSGYEYTVQDTQDWDVGEKVGIFVKPQDIHIMKKARLYNEFEGEVVEDGVISFGRWEKVECNTNCLLPEGWMLNENEEKVDANGEVIDLSGKKIKVIVPFDGVDMRDDLEEGATIAEVVSILYKGNHYDVELKTEEGGLLYVSSIDPWDDGDQVGVEFLTEKLQIELLEEQDD